jgi:hypothetical protein
VRVALVLLIIVKDIAMQDQKEQAVPFVKMDILKRRMVFVLVDMDLMDHALFSFFFFFSFLFKDREGVGW